MFRPRSSAEPPASGPGAANPSRNVSAAELAGWLPLAIVLPFILSLWAGGSATDYEQPLVALGLYLLFAVPVSGLVAVLLARDFLSQGSPKLLLVGMGAVFWACAGAAGSMAGISKDQANFTNTLLTIHNTGMWLSALCHLAGATLTVQWRSSVRDPPVWLAAGYGLALTAMVVLVFATLAGLLPTFFVPSQGPTLVRELVLFSTVAMLGVTGILFAVQRPSGPQTFTYWYGQALLLFAAGVLALVLSVPGTLLGWTGRITLAVGSIYMLVAVLKSGRQHAGQELVPEARFSKGGLGYAVAVAVVAAAAAVRVVFLPALGEGYPFGTFYPALAFAALYGGWRAGVLATTLAALIATYFWIEPTGQLALKDHSDWLGISVFLIAGLMISWMADRMRTAEAQARQAEVAVLMQRDRLDELVRERTADLIEAQRVARLGHWRWNLTTDEVDVSDEILTILGRSNIPRGSEQAGTLYPIESWQKLDAARSEALHGGSVFDLELQAWRGDGTGIWIEIRGEAMCNSTGEVVGLGGTIQDITQRKHADEQLRVREEQYRTLFANMTEAFVVGEPILDEQGSPVDVRFLEVNDAFHQQTGIPRGIEGRPLRGYLPQLEQSWVDRYSAVALTGQADRFENYNTDTRRHYDVYTFCPTPGRFAVLFRDITDEKRVQEALQERETDLRQLIAALPGMVWTATGDGAIDFFSQQWMDYTGAPLESQLGVGGFQSINPEDREMVLQAWLAAVEGKAGFDVAYRLRRHDGEFRWFKAKGTPIQDQDGKVTRWLGIVTDIDDLKQVQEVLLDTEQRYQALFNNKTNAIAHCRVITNEHGQPVNYLIEAVNDAYEQTLGVRRENIEGRLVTESFPGIENFDFDFIGEFGRIGLEGGEGRFEMFFPSTSQWLSLYAYSPEYGEFTAIFTDISTQKEAETAILRINADLEQRVAERTQELTRANEALLASNEELQRFANIASHDLQTPLRTITGFSQILQKDYGGQFDERADELIGRIVGGAHHMHALIRDLLAYSRVDSQTRPFEPVDFLEVFLSVLASVAGPIQEIGAQVTHGELPRVMGDRGQLTQLLQNLIENGIKYRGTETPRIHVWAERQQGEWAFSVRDNGIGIDEKHRESIFEVFRRLHTQQTYPGTGIGLSVCRRVVERHGGRIWVESERGRGSVFHFTLPLAKEVIDRGRRATDSPAGRGAAGRG